MPCLRIYTPYIASKQKRHISQKLIEISSRVFQLGVEYRRGIDVEFVLLPPIHSVTGLQVPLPKDANFLLEVNGYGLTDEKKRAFVAEVEPMLTEVLAEKPRTWLSRMQGARPSSSYRPALLFNDGIATTAGQRRHSQETAA